MTSPISRREWGLFLLLSLFWGSSYLWIKIGIETLAPLTLIVCRLGIASLILGLVVALAREPLPRGRTIYVKFAVMALVNIAIPFSLITWGERYISSALAAILQATTPLFTLLLASLALADESITTNKLVGLAIGFGGVVVLMSRGLGSPAGGDAIYGEVAIVLSSFSYAAGNVFVRRYVHGLRPMIPAFFQVTFGLIIAAALAVGLEWPIHLPDTPRAIVAVTWLGVFGSACAYLLYFRLVHTFGPTRLSLITYVMPIVAIALGFFVLGEGVDARIVLGTALILGGVGLVNARVMDRWRAMRGT